MIDLVAQGPVYRGHKLARIVEEYATGDLRGKCHVPPFGLYATPTSTKAWARLDVRVIGNPWGLSMSDVPPRGWNQEWGIGPFGGGY